MTTVAELFKTAGVSYGGAVRWGQPPSEGGLGIYVVSLSESGDEATGLDAAPLDTAAVSTLVKARPEASIDGNPATEATMQRRLREMWVPSEPVLYVGLAGTSVRTRVAQYYNTKIGARAPHAGGWPIKMLDQAELWVHFGPAQDPDAAEMLMLRHFEDNVPLDTRATLIDQRTALPFANLTHPRGLRKRHGLAGVKAPRAVADRSAVPRERKSDWSEASMRELEEGMTQNVTSIDVERGQLRIARSSKGLLPEGRSRISIRLIDVIVDASWDPRVGDDRERSGVLRFPKAIFTPRIQQGAPRKIIKTADGLDVI